LRIGRPSVRLRIVKTGADSTLVDLIDVLIEAVEACGPTILEAVQQVTGITHQTLDELRRMGHPYSVAHPAPPQPAGIINYQTGTFSESFEVTPVRVLSKQIVVEVKSNSPIADALLRGTPTSIPRPYDVLIEGIVAKKALEKILNALSAHMQFKVVGS
jgi:hypothetical protein